MRVCSPTRNYDGQDKRMTHRHNDGFFETVMDAESATTWMIRDKHDITTSFLMSTPVAELAEAILLVTHRLFRVFI